MNALSNWLQAPFAKALGWTLFHFVWEGTAIALILAAGLSLCRSSSARLRYTLACLAMLAMPLAFGVTAARLLPGRAASAVAFHHASLNNQVPPQALPFSPTEPFFARVWDHLSWAVPFWIAGVFVFYVRSLGGCMAARQLRRTGVCPAPAEWHASLDRLRNRVRLSRPVVLMESCLTDVPVVIGLLRPVILMPVGLLTGLPASQLESILLHELAHVRRHDYLVNLLQNFVEGLLYYHPAVWWVSGLIRAERENCCDDIVVAVAGDPRAYAATLAALEESRWPARQPALAAAGGSLTQRIRRLLNQPEGPRTTMAPVFSTVLLLLSVAAALTAWQPAPPRDKPRQAAAVVASPQTRKKPVPVIAQVQQVRPEIQTPYDKWLKEDVAYIISDEERAAFQRLATDEERERFIEQFWLRRDPTPGTAANEFKEEHYRRIAYANQNFAAGIPGWKTDFGRIYITYGPPDEKERHLSGGPYQRPPQEGGGTISTFPFEQWRYRYIEGIGNDIIVEFVDPTMSGEYHMTTDPSEKDALLYVPSATFTSKTGATLQVFINGSARISIPLGVSGNDLFNVYGRITAPDQRVVSAFEVTVRGPVYRKFVRLAPGSYRLNITRKALNGGTEIVEEFEFSVK